MTEETKAKLGLIAERISDARDEVREYKRRLARAEREIADLEADRWQLILTQ